MNRELEGGNAQGTDGFTLIEVLVVVVIIGIIAAIGIPGFLNAMDKSKQVASAMTLRAFGQALEIYHNDNGNYPGPMAANQLIPYLSPYADSLKARDNWKNDLHYAVSPRLDGYSIESWGKDGIDAADVSPATRYQFSRDIIFSDGSFTAAVE